MLGSDESTEEETTVEEVEVVEVGEGTWEGASAAFSLRVVRSVVEPCTGGGGTTLEGGDCLDILASWKQSTQGMRGRGAVILTRSNDAPL